MPTLWRDLRYACRGLRRSPAFTAAAVLTLALGIGANTAIFSVLDALLLRHLPVERPDQLVLLHYAGTLEAETTWDRAAYDTFRDRKQVFSGFLAFAPVSAVDVVRDGRTSPAQIELVSGNYFGVLGVRPFAGAFPDTEAAVAISFDYWRREFQSDPRVVGKSIRLQGRAYTIAGVTPPQFFGAVVGESPDLYVPFGDATAGAEFVTILARLKPGILPVRAKESLEPVFQEVVRQSGIPAVEVRQVMARLLVSPAAEGVSSLRDRYSLPVRIAMFFVGLLLLIACSNVANLLLARGIARERESAIRMALGAGRGRLIRQFLTESAVLALAGTAAGFGAGKWLSTVLVSLLRNGRDPVVLDTALTGRVALFTAAVTLLSVLACGLIPALSATRLRARFASRPRAGKFLVVGQVALSMTALFCSALLLESLVRLEAFDVGFDRDHVLAVTLGGNGVGEPPAQVERFYRELIDEVKALPGVRNASLSALSPVGGRVIGVNVAVEGYTPQPGEETHVFFSAVSPGYFATLGIPLLAGRDFGAHDNPESPHVAVINRSMARHYFGERDPIGQRFRFVEGNGAPMEIAGVAADSKYNDLRERTPDFVYLCRQQSGRPTTISGILHVRFAGNSARPLSARLPALIHALDNSVAIRGMRTLRQQIDESLHQERSTSALGAAFSLLALLLTSVGLYGLVSFGVARRSREIGIRMALGAQRGAVVGLILREVAVLAAVGVLAAIPLEWAASRLISGILFGVPAHDPRAIVLSTLTLAAVALLAGYLPARRAARIDPMAALRFE